MSEVAEAPVTEQPVEHMSQEYVKDTIRSAIPESDLKYLKPEQKESTTKEPKKKGAFADRAEKKPAEVGDNDIPLDDDEPEKVIDEETEPPPEDEDESIPEAKAETDKAKAATKWKMYREAYKENSKLKSELQTLKQQNAQLGDQSEVKTLREHVQALASERQRLIQLVEQGNIEQSDIWNREIMEPLNEMWGDIQTIAKRNSLDARRLATLVQNGDDEALKNYMDGENSTRPGDQNYLYGMQREVAKIEKKKEYLKANAHQLSQQSQQQMLAQRNQHFESIGQARRNAVGQIVPKMYEKIISVMPKSLRRDLQKDLPHILDFEKWEPDIQMYAGCSAVVLPDLLDSYNMLRTQLREAKTELVRLRGGSPKISTGGRTPTVPALPAGDKPKQEDLAKVNLSDFAEESTKRIRQALGYRR